MKNACRFIRRTAEYRRLVGGRQNDLFQRSKGTGTGIYAIDVASNKITEISETDGVFARFDERRPRNMFGIVCQNADSRPKFIVSSVEKFAPVQIQRVNADIDENAAAAKPK